MNRGDFFLLEFLEEYPLIITTFGMASRLVKYVYSKRIKKVMKENKEIESNEKIELS